MRTQQCGSPHGSGRMSMETVPAGDGLDDRKGETSMIGNKEEHFEGKGTDLSALQSYVEEYLKADEFTVQASAPSEQGVVIQAKKGGFLREVVAADHSMTITITGSPNDFTVRVGIGKWLEHVGITAIEVLLVSELFLLVDVADMVWTMEIENKLIANLKTYVG